MPVYNQGAVTQQQTYANVPNEVFGVAINWFAPRCPLLYRLPKEGEGSNAFQMIGYKYRPRTTTLGSAISSTSATTITVADNSSFMMGDVLKIGSEYLEVTADPNANGTDLTVRRGASGSTAATASNGATVTLVSNSRTGAENNPTAYSSGQVSVTQYLQTIQHPYTVGGSVAANTFFPTMPGTKTPVETYKMIAMQNCMDDAEIAAYQGKAEGGNVARPKMGGFRNIFQTNVTTSPSDASAYKATSFQRDLLTKPRKSGGMPNVVVVASNWMDAFATWGLPLQLLTAGATELGVPIRTYSCPFVGDVEIVEASLLPDFTAFSLTEAEVRWRVRRPLADEPYGKQGDTVQGHMIQELAIEADNEFHHAWLEGVTAFSA